MLCKIQKNYQQSVVCWDIWGRKTTRHHLDIQDQSLISPCLKGLSMSIHPSIHRAPSQTTGMAPLLGLQGGVSNRFHIFSSTSKRQTSFKQTPGQGRQDPTGQNPGHTSKKEASGENLCRRSWTKPICG